MQELLRKDLIYKVAALLFSILLWFYVTNLQNPTIERTVTGVPLSFSGLQEGLVMGEHPQMVDIKVKGTRTLVMPLTIKDFKASVDLSQAKMGDNSFVVDFDPPPGVELINIKPRSFNVKIDTIKEKQLMIVARTVNAVAAGYAGYEPVLTPTRVVVRGAEQQLQNLDVALVTVDLNGAVDHLELTLPVTLLDYQGAPVVSNLLEISPANVQVFVPVIQNVPAKTVPIRPVLNGKPKEDWQVSRVVVEPETIKITGSLEKLMTIDQISTLPIDITGLQENLQTEATLLAPPGISLLYEPTVKILVQVKEAPVEKKFYDIAINRENQPEGLRVVMNHATVNVTLQGAPRDMAAISAADIKAIVDLGGLQAGPHSLQVKINLPNSVQVLKVEPGTVEVSATRS